MHSDNIDILLDYYGNLYFKYDNTIYDFNIDNKNKVYLEKYINGSNYNENHHLESVEFGKLKYVNKPNTLSGKIEKDISKEEYLYEDFDYDEEYENDSEDTEESVKFMVSDPSKFSENLKNIINGEDTIPIYEILIYDGTDDNSSILVKTKLIGITPVYRIKIFNNSTISFREIGESEKYFKLIIKDNILFIV